jgi:hypothetical protein
MRPDVARQRAVWLARQGPPGRTREVAGHRGKDVIGCNGALGAAIGDYAAPVLAVSGRGSPPNPRVLLLLCRGQARQPYGRG